MVRGVLSFAPLLLLLLVVGVACASATILRHPRKFVGALNEGLRRRGLDVRGGPSADDQWFTQKLDHFDSENENTWQQRYLVNDTFYKGGDAPIFFTLGGEGPLSPGYVKGHFISNLWAQEFGALIVALEHRFYGESMPTADSSTDNLRFLSSQQALADAAMFREFIQKKYSATGKWIVFGGSYSGSLSAWTRAKFPHLFAGAIGSSGPVRAKIDFQEYMETVATSIGPECAAVFGAASDKVTSLLATDAGRAQLSQSFNTCTPISDDNSAQLFIQGLMDGPSGVVQYNNDNVNYQPFNITVMCEMVEAEKSNPLQAWIDLTKTFQKGECIEVDYATYIGELQNTSAARSWIWQTCREFGWYQADDGPGQPFPRGLTLEFSLQQCNDIFKGSFVPDVNFTNAYYGSVDLQASNVAMFYGSIDPWHREGTCYNTVGPGRNLGPNSATGLINGTAHCADLYMPRAQDEPGLTSARQLELSLISAWLDSSSSDEAHHVH